jgi:acetyl-CoA synthetase
MNQISSTNHNINIGHACTSLQCENRNADRIAFRWIGAHEEREDFTFTDLDEQSSRFAQVLQSLGYLPGDIFFTFLPKMSEQFFAFLGSLKICLITGTLFANFGEDALIDRLGDSGAKGIITRKSFLKKLQRIRERIPALQHIILVDSDDHLAADILSYRKLMKEATVHFEPQGTTLDTPSILQYTSGSTGKPKGVLHRHGSLAYQSRTVREILNLQEDDIFWCTADQGWITGTSYGIIGPWSQGITQIHYGGAYDAERWFRILSEEKVTVWYTAPTALRMLMREDESLLRSFDLSHLRHIFSVGEPLNPEVIHWARRVFGKDIYDTWFQTETGAIMITNRPGLTIRPGSMGKPVSGIEAAVLADDGQPLNDGEQGNLCVKSGWDSMFTAYYGNEEVYGQKFRNGWYWTGDTACRDGDGYYWFMGRSDDVINTAGHLVSPFEVESALLEIEEIAESGVVGVSDEILYERVVAFVALHSGKIWTPDLELKIRIHVANRVSSIATPQEIMVVDDIPKNKSGKIMRRVLKARYHGQDAGDLSTLDMA